jgi:fatty acid desaturase
MDLQIIRKQIRDSLPNYVFQPQPQKGIAILVLIPLLIALVWVTISISPPWYFSLLIAAAIGQIYTIWGFAAHEALHGSIFRSKFGQYLLGYLGYVPFLISPLTWIFWHCQCHHGSTNIVDRDPDFVGTYESFFNSRLIRLRAMFTPGTHHWFSYLGLFCLFTLEGQYVLWFHEVGTEVEKRCSFNRTRAKLETIGMILFWIAFGTLIGIKASLTVIVLPMFLANYAYVSYILTQHLLRFPSDSENNPLRSTISVTVHPIWDFLHLHFGYHVEHHLFPNMSHHFGPRVREILLANCKDEYISIPYFEALGHVLTTPRIHYDFETLIEPSSGEKTSLKDILKQISNIDIKEEILSQ